MKIILPKIEPYKLYKDNPKYGWPDQYGSSYIAADYMEIQHSNTKLKHHWLHGCNGPWENAHPFLYVKEIPKDYYLLVARKDQEMYMKSQGSTKIKAIGLPICYLPETSYNRIEESILLMPTHLRPGEKYATLEMIKNYINFAQEIVKPFKYQSICLHSHFFKFPEFLEEFKKANLHIIEGASNNDKNALHRQKALFSQFSVMCTNGWGSHVAYALAFGCKISICGPKIEKNKEDFFQSPSWKNREDVVKIMFSNKFINDRTQFLKDFFVTPNLATKNVELGEWLIGKENKLTPSEMTIFFKHNDYLKNFLRFIKK